MSTASSSSRPLTNPTTFDHRHRCRGQLAQKPILALGERLGQLLERVQGAVVVHEAHNVAADAARDLHEARRLPACQRLGPRQVQEVGPRSAREHLEAHRSSGYGCLISPAMLVHEGSNRRSVSSSGESELLVLPCSAAGTEAS